MPEPTPSPDKDVKRLREELARLRLKLSQSTDKDIKAVLAMRIAQIEEELPNGGAPTPEEIAERELQEPAAAEIAEVLETVAPPTPDQAREAEKLVAQARVEKMRNNAVQATALLQKAAEIAPGSATVLEALGDNLIERRQIKAALQAYQKAFRLTPKNVGLEEKLANAALSLSATGSLEDQMRRGFSDSPFLTQNDIVARGPYAAVLTAVFPGAGHLALGKTAQGIFTMIAWSACLVWVLIKHSDVESLAKSFAGRGSATNSGVLFPLAVMVLIYIGSLASLKTSNQVTTKRHVNRPEPPVNLPFE